LEDPTGQTRRRLGRQAFDVNIRNSVADHTGSRQGPQIAFLIVFTPG
jgi:hypothetical protein